MHLENPKSDLPWRKIVVLNLVLGLLYFAGGNVGYLFTNLEHYCSPFWPPSGLAMAAVLIYGFRQVVPGIILGLVGIALQHQYSLISFLGFFSASLAESLIASTMLLAVGRGRFRFKNPTDIFFFLSIAVFLAPFVASTIAVSSFYMSGVVALDRVPKMWLTLLIGNAIGILVLTPFLLSLFDKKNRKFYFIEAVILITLTCQVGWYAFSHPGIIRLSLIPLLIWASLRFGFKGVSLATMLLGALAVFYSTYFGGIFNLTSSETDLLWIQCLTAAATIIGYFLATVGEVHEEVQIELSLNLRHKQIAEEALAILDQSINKSPFGFCLIDRNYQYIRINETLAKYNNLPVEYHIGKTVREIIPENAELIEAMIDRVFKTGESLMNNYFQGAKVSESTLVSGLVSYYPIRHPSTNEIFSVGITIQDMTEHLKVQSLLQEKQDFIMFAQEAGKIGSFEWDLQTGKIVWTSELENIYGLSEGEFGGDYEHWLYWIHPEDIDKIELAIGDVLRGSLEVNMEFRIITKQKEVKWIMVRGKKITDNRNQIVKFIGINIDVTEQKTVEHKLRVTEANLLHALSVRDEFVAIASHELKTPLTSLKLQTQIFQRGLENNDKSYTTEKIQSIIGKNASHIDRLTRLVDDMLDISRIRTGKLTVKKEHFELSTMLRDILHRMREQFEKCGSGQPIIDDLDEVYGEWDPLRIEQVMTNILTNAIRYGQGKEIRIAIQNREDYVRFSVKDQGLGIAKSDHQKIFQRYERGLLQREVSGLGIGLFITQQIVLAHKGLIWLESEIGQGTIFYVDLPKSLLPIIIAPSNQVESLLVE